MGLRFVTAGESHGPGLTCIVEGLPAGLELDREAIDRDMARRQLGHGRGGRMKIERASARETAARVAGGALARAYLRSLGVEVRSHVIQIGDVHVPEREVRLS